MSTTHTTTRQITDIEAHAKNLAFQISVTYRLLEKAHRNRISGLPLEKPIWKLREELEQLNEAFDLAIYELNYRRI